MADIKNIGGRPARVLGADELKDVFELAAHLTQDQLAAHLNMSRSGFQNILNRDESVRLTYDRGLAREIVDVSKSVVSKAKAGDFASAQLFLRSKAGWSDTLKQDHISSDGSMSPARPSPVAIYKIDEHGRRYCGEESAGAIFFLPDNGREAMPPEPEPVPKPKKSAPKAKRKTAPKRKPSPKRKTGCQRPPI